MRLLLDQQNEILDNYNLTRDVSVKDYYDAINQHAEALAKNSVLRPIEDDIRKICRNKRKCASNTINFKTIDGSFCTKCGYVYPF